VSTDAAAQLHRLLHTIPALSDGKPHAIEEVARLARADRDTILRDLFSLSDRYGEPGGFTPGLRIRIEAEHGVTVDPSRHFRRPMGLSLRELYGLDLGLAMLRNERPPAEQPAIDRARERIRRLVAKLPGETLPADPWGGDTGAAGDPAILSTLRQGLRERRKVRLTYRSGEAAESATRTISPYGLIAARGAWYIVADCVERAAVRIFRVDRVEDAKLLSAGFEVPPSFSLDSVVHDGRVFQGDGSPPLRVRYSPRVARWVGERERVKPDADGSVIVEYPLADVQWAVRHVLQYGPDAEVLAPASVRRAVRERLERILTRDTVRDA